MGRRWARDSIHPLLTPVRQKAVLKCIDLYYFYKAIPKYLYLLNIYERFIPVSSVRLKTDGRVNELLSLSADDQIAVNQ